MHFLAYFICIWLTAVPADCFGDLITESDCPEVNYSPCNCVMVSSQFIVPPTIFQIMCDKVPIAKVKDIFSKTTARHFNSFTLRVAPSEKSQIPADLLGSLSSSSITIEGGRQYKLIIDDNAFRSTKNKTKKMQIIDSDFVNQPNLAFLNDFQALTTFHMTYSKNIKSFQGLPTGIEYLEISDSRYFENATLGPNIVLPRLNSLHLNDNHMGNVLAAKILKNLASSSIDSLVEFSMGGNNLTKIPDMVKSFNKLKDLWLLNNDFTSIDTHNFPLPGSIRKLILNDNNISAIKPHVIPDRTHLEMYSNKLTRLDSYVFQSLLESFLPKTNFGNDLMINSNPIECDCHLAWLIVHRRDLMPIIGGGQCSNSTKFAYLNPEGFKNCPAFTCPTDINGNFPSPLSCSSYYTCTDGKSTLVNCQAGKVFNRSTRKCDVPKNVPKCK